MPAPATPEKIKLILHAKFVSIHYLNTSWINDGSHHQLHKPSPTGTPSPTNGNYRPNDLSCKVTCNPVHLLTRNKGIHGTHHDSNP
jgi:hypothetical protein